MRKLFLSGLSILTLYLLFGSTLILAQGIKISGSMEMTITSIDSVVVEDVKNHIVTINQSEGVNTGVDGDLFDGAIAWNMSSADLVMGNGKIIGYSKFTKGEDVAFNKWAGVLKTELDNEGKPRITFEGMYEFSKGTGVFTGIKGSGNFSGYYTSKTTYTATWEGVYTTE